MTDRANSTASLPENWEDIAVFRESFLRVHLDPEDAANLRAFGRWLWMAALSCDPPTHDPGEPNIHVELRAIATDFQQAEGYLQQVSQSHLGYEEDTPATRLSTLADEVGAGLSELTRLIEETLGPPPSTEIDRP